MEKLEEAELILEEVQSLRANQKAYFEGNKSLLNECKRQEKKIDVMLKNYFNPPQPDLFTQSKT